MYFKKWEVIPTLRLCSCSGDLMARIRITSYSAHTCRFANRLMNSLWLSRVTFWLVFLRHTKTWTMFDYLKSNVDSLLFHIKALSTYKLCKLGRSAMEEGRSPVNWLFSRCLHKKRLLLAYVIVYRYNHI